MLTDAQIEQITAKYGACNHDALQEAARIGVERGCAIGFGMSGEGYNGEWPYADHGRDYEQDKDWLADRDKSIRRATAEPHTPPSHPRSGP